MHGKALCEQCGPGIIREQYWPGINYHRGDIMRQNTDPGLTTMRGGGGIMRNNSDPGLPTTIGGA